MNWDSVRESLAPVGEWVAAHPLPFGIGLAVVAIYILVIFGTDVEVTDRGISIIAFGRPIYTVPFEAIKSVEKAPVEWSLSLGGLRFGNDPLYSNRWNRVVSITFSPFGRRIWIERTDGSLVVLAPSDRDKLLNDVAARRAADALPAAKAVIAAEIARRNAER